MRWTFIRKISLIFILFFILYLFLIFTNFSRHPSKNFDNDNEKLSINNQNLKSIDKIDTSNFDPYEYVEDENDESPNLGKSKILKIDKNNKKKKLDIDQTQSLIDDIPCVINGEITFTCLRDNNDEIYLPFKRFLQKYYEVTGYVTRKPDGEELFAWWHSKSKINLPSFTKYDPRDVFGSFANYNVENRDRVKLISGNDGVPLSTQWSAKPYPYSVQIAQYALEHYSKNLTESKRLETVLENGKSDKNQWQVAPEAKKLTKFQRIFDKNRNSFVFDYKTIDGSPQNSTKPGLFINFSRNSLTKWPILRFFAKFSTFSDENDAEISQKGENLTCGFTILLQRIDSQAFYYLHYLTVDELLTVKKPNRIFYGIGSSNNFGQWRRFTRNILTDFNKGYSLLIGRKKQSRSKSFAYNLRLVSFSLLGSGQLDDLSQLTAAHDDHFFDAVDWLIDYQNSNGGLPIPVRRTIAEGRLVLEPGWHSAMAQGHFLSAVCRAYALTGDEKYRLGASKALNLFDLDSNLNGVRAFFLNSTIWYEEYPTRPVGTFVLNGFIYALLGLYDSMVLCQDSNETARRLYNNGLKSLKTLLPMYDSGFGSMYDLRHVTWPGLAPNLARWDYHAVHVYQLYWLYIVENEPLFKSTADRWLNYAKGGHAKHN